jgi:hypothetical protein
LQSGIVAKVTKRGAVIDTNATLLRIAAERRALYQAYKDGELTAADFKQKISASSTQACGATGGNVIETNATLLKIAADRKALAEAYEEGDLTAAEFEQGLSTSFEEARAAAREIDQKELLASQRHVHPPLRLALYLVAAFAVGFFISPVIYPKLFGYRNVYECILHHSGKYGAAACMELYRDSTHE